MTGQVEERVKNMVDMREEREGGREGERNGPSVGAQPLSISIPDITAV